MAVLVEHKILAGLIQSNEFIKSIRKDLQPRFFTTQVGRDIARFCISHYDKYNVAPRENIDSYLDSVKQQGDHEKTKDIVSITNRLANNIEVNTDYLLGEAYEFFKRQSALELTRLLQEAVNAQDSDEITSLVNSYKLIEKPATTGVSPAEEEVYTKALTSVKECLFEYDGAVGELLNNELYKGAFVCYMAKTKGGKSFYLMDNALQALEQGLKVAFIQAGDMPEGSFVNRWYTSITKRNYKEEYCKAHYSPVLDCEQNQNGTCPHSQYCSQTSLFTEEEKRTKDEIVEAIEKTRGYEPCIHCQGKSRDYKFAPFYKKVRKKQPLSLASIKKANKDRPYILENFKVATYDNNSLTCSMLESLLDGWAKHEDFVPDVFIIDYMDIMTDKNHMKDQRQSVKNNVAMGLRRISTKYNHCLITATQSDSQGFSGMKLGMTNFRDESKIIHHVTCLLGINQTDEEKSKGIVKMNKICSRDEETDNKSVTICQDLSIGKPILTNTW